MDYRAQFAIRNRFSNYACSENEKPDSHGLYGMSQISRVINCPGHVKLARKLPDPEPSIYALQGTAAMRLIQYILTEERNCPDDDYYQVFLHMTVPVGKKSVVFDQDDIDAIKFCVDTVADYLSTKLNLTITEAVKMGYLYVEKDFSLRHIHEECYGRCDALIYIPFDRLVIFDYKHGEGLGVSVDDNKQCKGYGLGAWKTGLFCDVEKVVLAIIQPRCTLVPDVAYYEITPKDLLEYEQELVSVIAEAEAGSDRFKEGDWCRFCKVNQNGTCPLQRKALIEAAQEIFEPLFPNVDEMTDEQLGRFKRYESLIDQFLKSVREKAQTRALQGFSIPGCKLVRSTGKREKLIDGAEMELKKKLGDDLPDGFYNPRKLKTPKQLREVIKKAPDIDGVLEAEMLRIIDTVSVTPVGDLILVTEDDKRPAVDQQSINEIFNEINDGLNKLI